MIYSYVNGDIKSKNINVMENFELLLLSQYNEISQNKNVIGTKSL